MPDAFTLGPLLIPIRPAAVVGALFLAIWLCGRIARRRGLDAPRVRGIAEGAAWVGLAGARLGYVLASWSAFRAAPWTALYFWQPGYLAPSGIAFGAAFALWRLTRLRVPERVPALRALGAGYLTAALALAAFLWAGLLVPTQILRPGDRVPDFALVDLDGRTVRLSDLSGRGVVLNFWATWCPPCRREMPLLDAVDAEYGPRGLTVVGVDLAEPRDVVASYVASIGVSYAIWLDPGPERTGLDTTRAVYARFGGVGLPTTIFIDRQGVIRDTHVGELNRALLEERAEEILRP